MEGGVVRALVDTGCLVSVVSSQLVGTSGGECYIVAFDGSRVKCKGRQTVAISVQGANLSVNAIVSDSLLNGVQMILGMDVIAKMGGVSITGNVVTFGGNWCGAMLTQQPLEKLELEREVSTTSTQCGEVVECLTTEREARSEDADFEAGFDRDEKVGTVEKVEPEREVSTTSAQYGEVEECLTIESEVRIEDADFEAVFDRDEKVWTVQWRWKSSPPVLKNKISCYDKCMKRDVADGFEAEIERWIREGILVPWKENVTKGIIPLMAVVQPAKNKVRPVLDFRELNDHVACHTGDDFVDVCQETLRTWRRMSGASTIVDLKAAYLQIRVVEDLWQYQLVNYKGRTFALTRLGFGLNSAPRIMTRILKTVLGKDDRIRSATNSYVDDILMDDSQISAQELTEHLTRYGLAAKPPEALDGGTALGLKLAAGQFGGLEFSRGNEIPDSVSKLTKKELFSVCGKLIGHYPVAGWLRVACSYVKRLTGNDGWNIPIGDNVLSVINEILCRVKSEDPVKGKWYVSDTEKGTVWCDASNIALGALLEIDGNVVEDAAWLRKSSDFNHINVAELEGVMKGINMAIKWNLTEIDIVTDSATVAGWVKTVLAEDKRVRSKGASELLVKRRLGILKTLIHDFGLKVSIVLVPTTKNKADPLTRVKKEWLTVQEGNQDVEDRGVCAVNFADLKASHDEHHMGVDRTLFVARRSFPETNRCDVKKVVRSCKRCQSINPAPSRHETGQLSVLENWSRLALDITHFHQVPYLSMIDCGPGRFGIWKRLKRETAEFIVDEIEELFLERGPVDEVLMDNGTVFRSDQMTMMLNKWHIQPVFRAAYRASGNGIIERHHRTVKSIAEKSGISPIEAVHWYNLTPRIGSDPDTAPQRSVFMYTWKSREERRGWSDERESGFEVGDEVWVKPPLARCTTQWRRGQVTGSNSRNNINVNGIPRHVLDIRKVVELEREEEASVEDEENVASDEAIGGVERIARDRRAPRWMSDYVSF